MSHTLHRRGKAEGMKNDFVLFAMSAKGINEVDSAGKLRRFLEILSQFNPVNMGDMKTGNEFITPVGNVIASTQDTSIVHGVFGLSRSGASLCAGVRRRLVDAVFGAASAARRRDDVVAGPCTAAVGAVVHRAVPVHG